ncbi:unnamed protein product, partial [Rangifer tarandus platyrhynchus]
CVKVKSLSRVQFFGTPWTAAYQAPLSMGFSRQEYWSGQQKHLAQTVKNLPAMINAREGVEKREPYYTV